MFDGTRTPTPAKQKHVLDPLQVRIPQSRKLPLALHISSPAHAQRLLARPCGDISFRRQATGWQDNRKSVALSAQNSIDSTLNQRPCHWRKIRRVWSLRQPHEKDLDVWIRTGGQQLTPVILKCNPCCASGPAQGGSKARAWVHGAYFDFNVNAGPTKIDVHGSRPFKTQS